MNGKRQKTQDSLALEPQDRSETPVSAHPRVEPSAAKPASESPAGTEQLMEEVCDGENLQSAWKRVRRNQGSPGVDGMTIDDAKGYLREHWPNIRSQLLDGTYHPQPVRDGLNKPCFCHPGL
jgi:RNA-directed DNA polymerase